MASVDIIKPAAAKKLAGHQFPRLKDGFMAVGTYQGRSFRVGYALPQGYYVEWDIVDFGGEPETFEEKHYPMRRLHLESDYSLSERMAAAQSGGGLKPRLVNPKRKHVWEGYKGRLADFEVPSQGKIHLKQLPGESREMYERRKAEWIRRSQEDRPHTEFEITEELSNPRGATKIYQKVLKIYASKAGMKHHCDEACKRAGHRYVHSFKKSACIYGLADGSILIR